MSPEQAEAYRRGVILARREVAEYIRPDDRFYSPQGVPWCRFGFGLRCLNGEVCRNPRHRG